MIHGTNSVDTPSSGRTSKIAASTEIENALPTPSSISAVNTTMNVMEINFN